MKNDPRDPRTYAIIGAAMEVHRQLARGFLEAVYQEALAIELQARGIAFRKEVDLPVFYKERRLACEYRADYVCFESVIVELKAVSELGGVHEAQIINYLKATGMEIGLLINFGGESLEYKRFIRSTSAQSAKSVDRTDHPQIAQISQMGDE
jgi:GxxExxY protein